MVDINVIETIPKEVQQSFDINMSLESFLDQAIEGKTAEIMPILLDYHITAVKDLKLLREEGWKTIETRIPADCMRLKCEVDKLCNESSDKTKKEDTRSPAEQLSDWHKVKLYLYYFNKNDATKSKIKKYTDFGLLDKFALNLGFEELRKNTIFDFGLTINEIQNSLYVYTTPQNNQEMREKSHGLIFYGPPGTGKTKLSTFIIEKAGFAKIVYPLSSAELNRSAVGGTEKLLMAIFQRASYCPHLLCCIAIDEVDALTPKRNDNVAGHKVDALSLLLSLIGGIKDVPNVFVIASTNRLSKIDEAFSRRLQDKFYIGRLTNKQRIDLLKQIVSEKACLPKHVKIDFNNSDLESLMAKLTTNFSGAALAALRSRILNYFDMNNDNREINCLKNEKLIELAEKVAHDFQVKLGRYSIPRLIRQSKGNFSDLWSISYERANSFTGRILVKLNANSSIMEFERVNAPPNDVFEVNISEKYNVRYASDLIPYLLELCHSLQIDNIQLIDIDTTSANDENSINELVSESLEEFEKFDNGLIIFDVDTLVGINETYTDSSSGSKSYSIQNQRLWQNILHAFKKTLMSRKWCIIISGSSFLIDQFKKIAKFPLSSEEKRIKKDEEDDNTKERTCLNCNSIYYQSQNRIDACSYHKGKLVKGNDRIMPTSKETLLKMAESRTPIESNELFNKYYYLCCYRKFSESREMGCTRNMHREEIMNSDEF